jgi:hypothetical protein
MSPLLDLPHPYLLFLGDTTEKGYAKTAFGLRDLAPDRCVEEWAGAGATVTTLGQLLQLFSIVSTITSEIAYTQIGKK